MQSYVSDQQLAERYSVSRSTVWRWANKGILPSPIQISSGCTRWKKDEIEKREIEREEQAA